MTITRPIPITRRTKAGLLVFILLFSTTASLMLMSERVSATDYTFPDETADYGSVSNPTNRNAEDGAYETMTETDSQSDTDYNSPSKSITYGSESGTFPDNLQTSNDVYWQLQEVNENPSDDSSTLVPTSDVSVGLDATYPTSPTDHYSKVDEGASHDSATTYNRAITNGDKDIYGLGDMSAPSGSPDLDVTIWVVCQDAGTGTAYFDGGVVISSTEYAGINDQAAPNTWTAYSYTYEANPAGGEWTYTVINGMAAYIDCYDAAPDVDFTSVYVVVSIDYSVNYRADATLTWSSTATDTHTLKFSAILEAKTSAESFYLQIWDYTASGWNTRQTVSATSDTSYDYDLTSDERSGAGEIQLRILDATASGDTTTADTIYLDVSLIRRVDVYYRCSVRLDTAATVPSQELEFKVKGYCDDGESWAVELWNYTSSGWDSEFTITALSNTWHSTDVYETSQLSGGEVKCRFDNQGSPDKTTASHLYLDYVCVRTANALPALSQMGSNEPKNLGETALFWAIYTDADNDAPSYMRVVIDSTEYAMTKNDSEDVTYSDGCAYGYSTSALTGGTHPYYFACSDGVNPEQTGGNDNYVVNRIPTLDEDTVVPLAGNNGDTFSFCVVYTDLDNDAPVLIKAIIDSTEYDMAKNDSEDLTYSDGCAYHYDKAMTGGSHTYSFKAQDYLSGDVTTTGQGLDVNNKPTLSSYSRLPGDPCYPTTEVTFSVVYTDLDNEPPTSIKWREGEGLTQNLTMTETEPGDTTYSDGKTYSVSVYLSHGLHEYDHYATDGVAGSHVMGGDNSITIGNRDPVITDCPEEDETSWRNVYCSFDCAATDADGDGITWEMSTNCTELDINSVSGLIYGTASDAVAWYTVDIWANDSYSGSDTYYFELHIVNREPVISSSANTSQGYGTYLEYLVLYSDPDSDTVSLEFQTESEDILLVGDYIQGICDTEGVFHCKLWANDTYGGSDLQEWDLTVSNQIPYVTSTPIYTVANNTAYLYDANFTDPEGQPLTYALDTNCSELTIDEDTGEVSGTPLLVGSYWLNITASDGSQVGYQNFSLTCYNLAPVISSSPDTAQDIGDPYYYLIVATDGNDDTLSYHLETAPEWLFINEATGEIEGTPTLAGLYTIEAYVWDGYAQTWQNWSLDIPATGGDIPTPPEPEEVLEESMYDWMIVLVTMMIFMTAASAWIYGRRRKR